MIEQQVSTQCESTIRTLFRSCKNSGQVENPAIVTVKTTETSQVTLIEPYGGRLVDLLVPPNEQRELREYGNSLPSQRLSARSMCDLEMLATGAFSPVRSFLGRDDYRSVLDRMRLADGHVFPVPVTLPVDDRTGIREGDSIGLRDLRNNLLAVLDVREVYEWDCSEFQQKVLGTTDLHHPLVAESETWGKLNVSGRIRVLQLPEHYDFPELRLPPGEVRSRLESLGNPNVVAFQTRNPLHRAHEELTKRAIEDIGGVLLLHPVAGVTRTGDINHFVRVRTYRVLAEKYFSRESVLLSLLPLAMRFAGPREALWHAVIRRNYGANYLIIGRDHASPGPDANGRAFYDAYAAQELVGKYAEETGVDTVPFHEFAYVPDEDRYRETSKIGPETKYVALSGTQVRKDYLDKGRTLPEWFTRPEVAAILKDAHTPKDKSGFCLWFTGLSGAGKSTTAEIVTAMLNARERVVTLLDGDIVRTNLSEGLGFDKAGRDANVRRIGFVASEIVRHNGVAICAAVSPYRETRSEVRKMFGSDNFIEVFMDTPIEVCEQRDTKGMYARARRGEIRNFTGISDIYEAPLKAEITLVPDRSADENARLIIEYLCRTGFIRSEDDGSGQGDGFRSHRPG